MPDLLVGEFMSRVLRYFAYVHGVHDFARAGDTFADGFEVGWLSDQVANLEPFAADIRSMEPRRIIPACDRLIDQLKDAINKARKLTAHVELVRISVDAFVAAGILRNNAQFWEEHATG